MEQRQSLGRKVQAKARCHMMRRSSQNAARMLRSLATRMVASTMWRRASQRASECGILPPVGMWMCRSFQNAARMLHSLATRDGCLYIVAARFQRASECGFQPPVLKLINDETC